LELAARHVPRGAPLRQGLAAPRPAGALAVRWAERRTLPCPLERSVAGAPRAAAAWCCCTAPNGCACRPSARAPSAWRALRRRVRAAAAW